MTPGQKNELNKTIINIKETDVCMTLLVSFKIVYAFFKSYYNVAKLRNRTRQITV